MGLITMKNIKIFVDIIFVIYVLIYIVSIEKEILLEKYKPIIYIIPIITFGFYFFYYRKKGEK